MTRLSWSADTLLRAEQYRGLSPRRFDTTKNIEEYEKPWRLDAMHRATRDNILAALLAAYAESIGLMVSTNECSLKALVFNSTKPDNQGELPPMVALLDATKMAPVSMRSGPGAGVHNAEIFHTALAKLEAGKASARLKQLRCRRQVLPFSFVNSRSLLAVQIRRGPEAR